MPIMTKRTCDSLSMDATTVDVQLSSVTTNGDQVLDDRTTTDNDNNNSKAIQNQNQSSTDHEIKKVKYETQKTVTAAGDNDLNGQTKKSRVVHVRNIPSDTCDQDLIQLASGFGRVTNCLILRGKSQAFVEFLDTSSAQQMVNYWLQTQLNGPLGPMQPSIRGRHVFCQLSNHKELKTTQNGHSGGQTLDGHSENGGGQNRTSEPSCVLRVVVENQLYQVSLDVLHQVFSRAGKVQKIVTFTKNQCFQALIQFESPREATLARQALDGQNLFHHANTLRIEFSKLLQLNVKYNNDKSRDYTNNQLPAQLHTPPTQSGPDGQQSGFAVGSDHHSSPLSLLQQQQQQSQNQNSVQTMFQMFSNPLNPSMRSLVNPFSALNALSATHAQSLAGQLGAHLGLGQQLAGHVNGVHGSGGGVPLTSAVLLVSNLNEATTTTDALFTLFGVYGDVIRVKILFNKKDNALIQMAEPAQAHLAQTYLDKVKLNGRVIRVTPSKHQLVQMPKEGQHDAGLTKDFSQSSLHRFKKPGSKNYGNIYPPSATLHLSNIPQSVQEEDIRSAFQRETNSQVVNFKFFPKDRKMALIQLPTVDDAIQALIKMHNYQLSESSHLRVSFSKSSI